MRDKKYNINRIYSYILQGIEAAKNKYKHKLIDQKKYIDFSNKEYDFNDTLDMYRNRYKKENTKSEKNDI